jgi:hypothetical protein
MELIDVLPVGAYILLAESLHLTEGPPLRILGLPLGFPGCPRCLTLSASNISEVQAFEVARGLLPLAIRPALLLCENTARLTRFLLHLTEVADDGRSAGRAHHD